MLNGVTVGANDLEKAKAFYDAVLSHVGLVRLMQNEVEAGYGVPGGKPVFFVTKPFNKEPLTFGNGFQVQFSAESESKVDAIHKTALDLGGLDEGAPGPRS